MERLEGWVKVEVRYTINRDGTIEKWYLEAEADGLVYLEKQPPQNGIVV